MEFRFSHRDWHCPLSVDLGVRANVTAFSLISGAATVEKGQVAHKYQTSGYPFRRQNVEWIAAKFGNGDP